LGAEKQYLEMPVMHLESICGKLLFVSKQFITLGINFKRLSMLLF
jgi:hypothetical protein